MQQQLNIPSEYEEYPSSTRVYEVNGKKYIVVSHFIGNKDLDKVLLDLARKRAYADMKISV